MDLTRYFIVLIPQTIITLFFLIIVYKILKRRKDSTAISLSLFYISLIIAFLLNIFAITLVSYDSRFMSLIESLYFLLTFMILFSIIFLVIFISDLYFIASIFNSKRKISIIIVYGLSSFVILSIPKGIMLLHEGLAIKYSNLLFILLYFFISFIGFIPSMIMTIRIAKRMNFLVLRKKYKRFTLGIFGMFIDLYGAILYNTWHFPIYRKLWSILTTFLLLSSGFLIYYGIGKGFTALNNFNPKKFIAKNPIH